MTNETTDCFDDVHELEQQHTIRKFSNFMTRPSNPWFGGVNSCPQQHMCGCDTFIRGSTVIPSVYDGCEYGVYRFMLSYSGANGCTAMTRAGTLLSNTRDIVCGLNDQTWFNHTNISIIQKLYNGIQGHILPGCLQVWFSVMDDGANNLYLLRCELRALAGHQRCPCIVSWATHGQLRSLVKFSVSELTKSCWHLSLKRLH